MPFSCFWVKAQSTVATSASAKVAELSKAILDSILSKDRPQDRRAVYQMLSLLDADIRLKVCPALWTEQI
jgi:hypothetical protein